MTGDDATGGDPARRLSPEEAGELAAVEYGRFGALLAVLDEQDWSRPTECAPWDVRLLTAHVVGATEANAALPEMVRQLRRGRRGLAVEVDPVSAFQVDRRRQLGPAELRARFARAVPGAVVRRRRWSRWAGMVPMRVGPPVRETWRLRYLMDVVYTRDVWMHRIDICRAVGRQPELTAGHDGRIVADVVADWMARHGRPVDLLLTGVAGGHHVRGRGGDAIVCDAVEFCRIVSGRGAAEGLLGTPVPF
ncbi:maleylpyruvate isomerase family mycothiol-dependent enzyme [Pseudonocardia sp. RS010]|uniref:maleylpyruvate isomerase family mycothiol-dependent enzyme n=1 Tax=Pseudonocardia sp. RS010 TaxID=3385979 RepID=UPI0039A06F9B